MMQTEVQVIQLLAGRGPQAKGNSQPEKPGKDKGEDFLHKVSERNTALLTY